MIHLTRTFLLLLCCALAIHLPVSVLAKEWDDDLSVFQKRQILLTAFDEEGPEAAPLFKDALDDDSETVRRTAAHLLVRLGEPGMAGVELALENDDFQVRRIAIDALAERGILPKYWTTILLDDHPSIQREVRLIWLEDFPLPEGEAFAELMEEFTGVYTKAPASKRQHVVNLFATFDEFNAQIRGILVRATADEDESIRATAYEALYEHLDGEWPEAPDLLAAALADEDEAVRDLGLQMQWKLLEVEPFKLPAEGWRFQTDAEGVGRDAGWYAVDFDDQEWRDDAVIESDWHVFLDGQYAGGGWYRRAIDLPEFADWDEAYLDFGAVDEEAWVWVNGEYAGEHAIGAAGWDVPFLIEVTELIKPGETNQITVLAKNTRGGGGIWKPVHLRVIDTSKLTRD